VKGVSQSLAFFPHLGAHHIPCFNHLVQLAFTHGLSSASVALIIAMLNDMITYLQTSDGIAIMGRCCPTLVKIRRGSMVDVLRYTLSYRDIVNEVRSVLEHDPISESFTLLDWIFLPLELFSFAIECRECKLYEILPLAAEVVREFDQIHLSLLGTPETVILNSATAHFVAHMK
jgi:hypothetical protein